MKDRIPLNPGRVKLTPVAGQVNTYDMVRADGAVEVGTPLNKATLLTAQTGSVIGLTEEDPTVNDALRIVGICETNRAVVIIAMSDALGGPIQNVVVSGTASGQTDSNGIFAFGMEPGAFSLSMVYPLGCSGPGTVSGTSEGGKRTIVNRRDCIMQKSGTYEVRASDNLYLAPFIKHVDLFGVGGGGGGGANYDLCGNSNSAQCASTGGGGGFTSTKLNLALLDGQRELRVSVGAGGRGASISIVGGSGGAVPGGETSAVYNGAKVLSAGGGATAADNGGNGGSGGGAAVIQYNSETRVVYNPTAGPGGSDGNDGATERSRYDSKVFSLGGVGQHTTTRAFGEASGKVYGGGGGGAGASTFNDINIKSAVTALGGDGGGGGGTAYATAYGGASDQNLKLIGINGADGLGGGGGASAAAVFSRNGQVITGGSGGSGIVIIRWNEV